MDGKLLAQARLEKENISRRSRQEDRRRHDEAYARVPALRTLDQKIAALTAQAADDVLAGRTPDIARLQKESIELQGQRADLLAANGWPIDWLDGAWDCPKCRDAGYVHGQMCECLKKLYDQAQAADLSALLKLGNERFSTFDLTLYDSRPDPAAGVSPRQQMETVYKICCDYALNFKKSSMNLLFRGGTGLGKTFLSACIAREVAKQGFSVVYETAVAALGAFEEQHFARGGDAAEEAEALVRRMLDCDLLIVDDLGTEFVTEFTKSALYTLVNARLTGRKKTIISTNLSSQDMARRYTPQIMSRLEGEYQVLPFVGSDIRILKKERGLE